MARLGEFLERSLGFREREDEHGDGECSSFFKSTLLPYSLHNFDQITISPSTIPIITFRSYTNLLTIVLLH